MNSIVVPYLESVLRVIVDEIDFTYISKFKWFAHKTGRNKIYVKRTSGNVVLHILIAKRAGIYIPGKHVDHKDGDTLNNRRGNLRSCTRSQNGANRGKQKNNTSGYKGVTFQKSGKRQKRWHAQIRVKGKQLTLGRFFTPEEASSAYKQAVKIYFGEFAKF